MKGYFISKNDYENENHSVYVYDIQNKINVFKSVNELENGKYVLVTFTNYNIACSFVANMMSNHEINAEDFDRIFVINAEELNMNGDNE